MQKLKKTMAYLLAVTMSLSTPITSMADFWHQETNQWEYVTEENGVQNNVKSSWKQINGSWYYFNEYGKMQTGWFQDKDNAWYWLNPQPGPDEGKMMTGWIFDGKKYYFMGKNGAWIEGYTDDDSDDTYSNKVQSTEEDIQIINTNNNVIAFDSTSEDGLIELEKVYEEIYDFWTDDQGTEDDLSDDTYNVIVGNESPIYQYILNGTYQSGDVIFIPACEYFPTGVSLIYLSHDDNFLSEMNFKATDYEVIHTRRASFPDIFSEDISISIDEISDEDPVSFVWVPEYTEVGEEDSSAMYSFSRNGVIETFGLATLGSMNTSQTETGQAALTREADFGAEKDVQGKGLQLQNLSKFLPTADFSDAEKGKIGIDFNKIVLYDHDGRKNTSNDRIVLDGEFTLANINPELALDWNFKMSDPLPQQFMAKLSYDEIKNVKLTAGGDLADLSDVYKQIKKSLDAKTHNNKRSIFGIDIRGVDMSNTIVLAAAGFNVGTKTVKLNIKSLRDQSIKVPFAPSFIVMIMMDMEGKISTTVVGEYNYTSYVEKGVNVQKNGYVGNHGTCEQNKGQTNFTVAGRSINIYNLQAKSRTEKNKEPVSEYSLTMDGSAELKTGIGAGMGVMFAGIMPAMVKATIGPEAKATLNGKASYSSAEGVKTEGEGKISAALVLRAKADINLTAKTLFGTPGITGSWDLAKYTLAQFSQIVSSNGKLNGKVFISDDDRNETNNSVLANARVVLQQKDVLYGGTFETSTDDVGTFNFENLPQGSYILKVSKEGYLVGTKEVEIPFDNDLLKVYLDKQGSDSKLVGYVTAADQDSDSTNNAPLSGVKVTLSKVLSNSQEVQQFYTSPEGKYTFDRLPAGLYEIQFELDGYITIYNELTVSSGATAYNTSMEIISNDYEGEGVAEGTIINALNAQNVGEGIILTAREGINRLDSEIIATSVTDQSGHYSLTLSAGNYTVSLSDPQEPRRYMDDKFYIKVFGGKTLGQQNGEMVPVLDTDEIRVVLTWGSSPRDLDSHLTGPDSTGSQFHVFYQHKEYLEEGIKEAALDVDDTSSFGPETITIYKQNPGIYHYAVHDYTNRYSSDSEDLANSGAYVRVYQGGGKPIKTFSVPIEPGTVWNVFDYNSETGEIILVDTMDYQEDPTSVGKDNFGYASYKALLDNMEEELPLKDYELEELATPSEATKLEDKDVDIVNVEATIASPSEANSSEMEDDEIAEESDNRNDSNINEKTTIASPSEADRNSKNKDNIYSDEDTFEELEQNSKRKHKLPMERNIIFNDIMNYVIFLAWKQEELLLLNYIL